MKPETIFSMACSLSSFIIVVLCWTRPAFAQAIGHFIGRIWFIQRKLRKNFAEGSIALSKCTAAEFSSVSPMLLVALIPAEDVDMALLGQFSKLSGDRLPHLSVSSNSPPTAEVMCFVAPDMLPFVQAYINLRS